MEVKVLKNALTLIICWLDIKPISNNPIVQASRSWTPMIKKLNIYMKQFRATVRASGIVVTTIVFAENTNFATKILQAQFGAANVISIPSQIGNGL